MRCPRHKISVGLEICAARKERKMHGCTTCAYPKHFVKDQERINGLVVGLQLEPKPSEKYTPLYIKGLATGSIKMSRQMAMALRDRLDAVIKAWR